MYAFFIIPATSFILNGQGHRTHWPMLALAHACSIGRLQSVITKHHDHRSALHCCLRVVQPNEVNQIPHAHNAGPAPPAAPPPLQLLLALPAHPHVHAVAVQEAPLPRK